MRRLLLLVALAACEGEPPELAVPDQEVCATRRDGAEFCIDRYEASRRDATPDSPGVDDASPPRSLAGLRPWTQVDFAGALAACRAKGKRLCTRDEWIDACDGEVGEAGHRYAYGDELDPAACNTGGEGPAKGGAFSGCRSPLGTLDQSGNVWEWTGRSVADAGARGGSFRSSMTHECTAGERVALFAPVDRSPELGFRCCRDP